MHIYIILLHLITIAQIRVKQFRRGAETKLLCTDVCGLYSSDASSSEAPMWGGCTCFSYISSFVSVNTTQLGGNNLRVHTFPETCTDVRYQPVIMNFEWGNLFTSSVIIIACQYIYTIVYCKNFNVGIIVVPIYDVI